MIFNDPVQLINDVRSGAGLLGRRGSISTGASSQASFTPAVDRQVLQSRYTGIVVPLRQYKILENGIKRGQPFCKRIPGFQVLISQLSVYVYVSIVTVMCQSKM